MGILAIDLNESVIQELCTQQYSESQTLDFKQTLPALSDKEKSEFLKDVCALANSDGGDLVYGVKEVSGKASQISPITGEDADAAKRRLGQVLDAGIEPRLVGLQLIDVPVAAGGYVLVVRVPASFNGPHRYTINGVGRFVMRNGTHTTELTYGQLRNAFDRTASLAERARNFRETRLKAIANRKTWRRVVEGPICVVHLIPIAAMNEAQKIDVSALSRNYTEFMFSGWNGGSRSTNLDGLVVYPGGKGPEATAFTQIFRSGALEAVRSGALLIDPTQKAIPSATVSGFYREAIGKFLDASRKLGFSGPAIMGIALLGVGDYIWATPDPFEKPKADRPDLVLPEVWIDHVEAVKDVDEVARPVLEMLWQAFDVEVCMMYDRTGKWQQRY